MTSEPGSQPTKRRNFITKLIAGWATLIFLPVFAAITRYLIPPESKGKEITSFPAGNLSDIPPGGAKIVKANRKAAIVLRSHDDQVKAFSAICTHLGCLVEFRQDDGKIHCNCHGSVFDANGKNIEGPAPRPLPPYRVTIVNSEITLTSPDS